MTTEPLDPALLARLRAAEADDPAPSTLLPRIMRGVWTDARHRLLPVTSPGGPASVAAHVVTAVVEDALGELVGLQVLTCAVEPPPGGPADAVTIRLAIATAYGVDLASLTRRVRTLVAGAGGRHFGWDAGPIDIDVLDVYLLPDSA